MIFPDLFADQLRKTELNPYATRSKKNLYPIHSTIADIVAQYTKYKVMSFPGKEYCFISDIGTKDVDIAIVDEKNTLKGAIMFKSIKSEYNKNANNYYENMKGESSLFIDNGIPVYQIIFIPTKVRHRNSHGEKTFEIPTGKSYKHYCNFIKLHPPYWDTLKLGVYYFDVDYKNDYKISYSKKVVPGVEGTLTEGLINFMKEVK